MISKELLDILCCPACRGELIHDPGRNELACRACGRLYRVEEEIPVLVVGEEKKKS
jgi:uncharacterized protein